MTSHPIRPVSSRLVYENPWTRVREDKVEYPDGSTGIYGVVEKPDYSVVVAFSSPDSVVLVRQFRYAISQWTVEFPQGHVAGASPEQMALQELREETGYKAGTIGFLGRFHQAVGLSNQVAHVYLATELKSVESQLEASEIAAGLRVVEMSPSEIDRMIAEGEITDVSTVAAWHLAQNVT